MALTADQQQLANILANYGQYSNLPTTGGMSGGSPEQSTIPDLTKYGIPGLASNALGVDGTAGKVMDFIDPMNAIIPGFGIFNSLFGKKKAQAPQWQPYMGSNGQYYWTNPNTANPIPVSDVPGATIAPSAEYQNLANQIRSISDLLPYYSQAISAQKIPDAMGQLAADTATTGPRLALQEALQRQYGPIFDQLAAESNQRKAMAATANDAAVLKGPGQELIQQALAAAKLYDPEYFATRAATGDSIQKLLGQTTANLDGGLSATERDEVGRGLALENSRRGTANAPSQLQTVQNAMQFGVAGRQRQTENQNQLSKAIAASTAFLPTSKSNVDVFQVATGKPSYNQQDNRFNTNTATADAAASAQGLLNTGASFWTTNANNIAQKVLQDDQQNDWGNRLGQVANAAGSFSKMFMGV